MGDQLDQFVLCEAVVDGLPQMETQLSIATDLSEPSLPAINAGIKAARERGSRLTLLHCLEWPVAPIVDGSMGMVWLPDVPEDVMLEKRAAVQDRLKRILEVAQAEGDIRCETGMPRDTILRVAEEEHSELIVLGSHGHSAWAHMALGSVTEWIVRAAPTSIQVVRVGRDG